MLLASLRRIIDNNHGVDWHLDPLSVDNQTTEVYGFDTGIKIGNNLRLGLGVIRSSLKP